MADVCKTCQLVHVSEVTCIAAQGVAMRALLEKLGEPTECRACHARIVFVRHANGANVPYTLAGLNHFIDCPGRDQFKRSK